MGKRPCDVLGTESKNRILVWWEVAPVANKNEPRQIFVCRGLWFGERNLTVRYSDSIFIPNKLFSFGRCTSKYMLSFVNNCIMEVLVPL